MNMVDIEEEQQQKIKSMLVEIVSYCSGGYICWQNFSGQEVGNP